MELAPVNRLGWILLVVVMLAIPRHLFAQDVNHHGWHLGGAGVLHLIAFDDDDDDDQSPPTEIGGGASILGSYRNRGRWEVRFNLTVEATKVTGKRNNKSPDLLINFSAAPILHFRKAPRKWDPYLLLPELGFMCLARNNVAGPSIAFPGTGLQVHLSDRLSLIAEVKVFWGLLLLPKGKEGLTIGFQIPAGVMYRF